MIKKAAFGVLRTHNMRLNPAKCAFGVSSGKFLGFIVSQHGIEANPEKIQIIIDMAPPRNVKEVQRLTGRLAAIGRFLSKSGEKSLPFFKVLRGTGRFEWGAQQQEAFAQLKEYLANPPLLNKPEPGEPLWVYLSASENVLSVILVREEEGVQKPLYYVSKVLLDAETRYSRMEKVAYALVIAARKLRPYFQTHSIQVLTDQPLKAVLYKPVTADSGVGVNR